MKIKTEIFTAIDMLLMVEKGIRGRTCNMKDYDKNRESLYLQNWDVNHFCGWAMSQKFPVNSFECYFSI